ncbi:MAG: HypC/HybG/HupF family hydrogenase formation chaperone [Candidatus Methanomethylicota archaeon]|nr:HypC/HybG/HupF family hydrogenase formation chaperone [Candidatus Culexmicrobium cathedralense]RLE48869.1 MAG: HypC/HybG/HupF family hydrogenase formation chaperone [Candidatus Verstraetearchaeota archaeon]
MCLAVPAKVVSVNGDRATVDFGGVQREILLTLIEDEVLPGDYVIVHAGFAIQKLDEETAVSMLKLWEEILSSS